MKVEELNLKAQISRENLRLTLMPNLRRKLQAVLAGLILNNLSYEGWKEVCLTISTQQETYYQGSRNQSGTSNNNSSRNPGWDNRQQSSSRNTNDNPRSQQASTFVEVPQEI